MARLQFTIPGQPKPKGRPRAKSGQTPFTPRETRQAEARVRQAFVDEFPGFIPYGGPLKVECVFWRETRQTVDTDNLLKLITDALNKVAFVDDRQIADIRGIRHYGAGKEARTVVRIEQIQEQEQ